MSIKKIGNINITGTDFSWIKENKKNIARPEDLDANIQIALRLRKCMNERGWSQKDLAAELNVSPQYINKVLRNQEPTFSVKVAEEYGNKLNYPLIRVCDESDVSKEIFMHTKSIISFQDIFSAADIWKIGDTKSSGFCYMAPITLRQRKLSSKSQQKPSYA